MPVDAADLDHEFLADGTSEIGVAVGRQNEAAVASHHVLAIPVFERVRAAGFGFRKLRCIGGVDEDRQPVDRHAACHKLIANTGDRLVGVAVVRAVTGDIDWGLDGKVTGLAKVGVGFLDYELASYETPEFTFFSQPIYRGSWNLYHRAPACPSDLTAVPSLDGIRLSWTDNSDDETGFLIEARAPGDAPWGSLAPAAGARLLVRRLAAREPRSSG